MGKCGVFAIRGGIRCLAIGDISNTVSNECSSSCCARACVRHQPVFFVIWAPCASLRYTHTLWHLFCFYNLLFERALLPNCKPLWTFLRKRGSFPKTYSTASRYKPLGHRSSRPEAARGGRPDSGGTETSQIPRKVLKEFYLAFYVIVRLTYSRLFVVLTPSSWSGEGVITRELVLISVCHHMHPCTRRSPGRPLARKVLCTMFYVEVEWAVGSVGLTLGCPSSKYVCVCNIVHT